MQNTLKVVALINFSKVSVIVYIQWQGYRKHMYPLILVQTGWDRFTNHIESNCFYIYQF